MSELDPVRAALQRGDKPRARQLLSSILKTHPTADAWCLAAQATETEAHAVRCLREALKIDEWHSEANRRLQQLEGAKSIAERERDLRPVTEPVAPLPPLKRDTRTASYQRSVEQRKRRQRIWTRIGCLGTLLLAAASSLFILNALGVGLARDVMCTVGMAPCPVTEIEGTPVSQRDDAVKYVQPEEVKQISRGVGVADMLQPGYSHEYDFAVHAGEEIAVMVQFISATAHNVPHNVAIFDSSGQDLEPHCIRDAIMLDSSGTILVCTVSRNETWNVRIFGREGESTGAYMIQVERFDQPDSLSGQGGF